MAMRQIVAVRIEVRKSLVSAQLADHADTPAKLVYKLMPQFPAGKRPDNNKGDVLLEMTVTADGAVVDPVVITSSHPEFEQAILDAVLKWRFEPAKRRGKSVDARASISISFKSS